MSASHNCNVFLEFSVQDGIISTRFSDTNKRIPLLQPVQDNSLSNLNKTDLQKESVQPLNRIPPYKKRRLVDGDLHDKRIEKEVENIATEEGERQPPKEKGCVESTQQKTIASDCSEKVTEVPRDADSLNGSELSTRKDESTSTLSTNCNFVQYLQNSQRGKDSLNRDRGKSDEKGKTCKKDYICLACFKNIRNFMCYKCCGNICNGGFSCPEIHAKEKCPICIASTTIISEPVLSI